MNKKIIIPAKDLSTGESYSVIPGSGTQTSSLDIIASTGPEYGFDVNYSSVLTEMNFTQLSVIGLPDVDVNDVNTLHKFFTFKEAIRYGAILKSVGIFSEYDILNRWFYENNIIRSVTQISEVNKNRDTLALSVLRKYKHDFGDLIAYNNDDSQLIFPMISNLDFNIKGKYIKFSRKNNRKRINFINPHGFNNFDDFIDFYFNIYGNWPIQDIINSDVYKDKLWHAEIADYDVTITDQPTITTTSSGITREEPYYFSKDDLLKQLSNSPIIERYFIYWLMMNYKNFSLNGTQTVDAFNHSFSQLSLGSYSLFETIKYTVTKFKKEATFSQSESVQDPNFNAVNLIWSWINDNLDIIDRSNNGNEWRSNFINTFRVRSYPHNYKFFNNGVTSDPEITRGNDKYSRLAYALILYNVHRDMSTSAYALSNFQKSYWWNFPIMLKNSLTLNNVNMTSLIGDQTFKNRVMFAYAYDLPNSFGINYSALQYVQDNFGNQFKKFNKIFEDYLKANLGLKNYQNVKVNVSLTEANPIHTYVTTSQSGKPSGVILSGIELLFEVQIEGYYDRVNNFSTIKMRGIIFRKDITDYLANGIMFKSNNQRIMNFNVIDVPYDESKSNDKIVNDELNQYLFMVNQASMPVMMVPNLLNGTTIFDGASMINLISGKKVLEYLDSSADQHTVRPIWFNDEISKRILISDADLINQELVTNEGLDDVINLYYGDLSARLWLVSDGYISGGQFSVVWSTPWAATVYQESVAEMRMSQRAQLFGNEYFKSLADQNTYIAIEKNKIDVKRDIINKLDEIRDLSAYSKNLMNYQYSIDKRYSIRLGNKGLSRFLKNDEVNDNYDVILTEMDDLLSEGAITELYISYVPDWVVNKGVFDINDESFINSIIILNSFEPFSDSFIDYVNSPLFIENCTVNGIMWVDGYDFRSFINEKNNQFDFMVLDQMSDIVKSSADEVSKVVSSLTNVLTVNPKENLSVQKGKEVAQALDAFEKINNGIDGIIQSGPDDIGSVKLARNRLNARVPLFDVSLGDPNIILADWKYRTLNNFADLKLRNDNGKDSYKKFNDLIEGLAIPIPDFNKIGDIMRRIINGVKTLADEAIKAAANAMAIYDNLYNIMNIVRFPVKVKEPVICYNPESRKFECYLLLPHGIDFNESLYSRSVNSPWVSLIGSRLNDSDVKVARFYIPEINLFARGVIISIDKKRIEQFNLFAKKIIKNRKLSDLSKFVSLLSGEYLDVWLDLSTADEAWIGSLVSTQVLVAAGSAFLSSKDKIAGAIGAAVSGLTTLGVNLASATNIRYHTNTQYNRWFRDDQDDKKRYSSLVQSENYMVCSVRNVSAIPMTTMYIAGSVMVEVIKILGGFAISTLVGAVVGQTVRRINNSLKLRARRKEYMKEKNRLLKEKNKEIKNINADDLRTAEHKGLSDKEWKKVSGKLVEQQKEKINLKYSKESNGVINMNKSQLRGMAEYNLFLNNNGIVNSELGSKIVSVGKKQMLIASAAAGAVGSTLVGVTSKITGLVKKNFDKVRNKDDDDQLISQIVGL